MTLQNKSILVDIWPNLGNQNHELPGQIFPAKSFKIYFIRLVSASLGQKSYFPKRVLSSPVQVPLKGGCNEAFNQASPNSELAKKLL